jgi:hypothetical protein
VRLGIGLTIAELSAIEESGTGGSTEANETCVATGFVGVSGTSASTEPNETCAASGTCLGPPMPSATLAFWYRADIGVTIATGVSQWAKAGGIAGTLAQATTTKQPVFNATAGPNSRPTIRGDGVDDFLHESSMSGSAPFHVFAIAKVTPQSAASNHDTVFDFGAFLIDDTTPRTIANDGTSLTYSGNVANGAFARLEIIFGSSGSIIENGTTRASGNTGTGAAGGITLFSLGNASTHSTTTELCEIFGYSGGVVSGQDLTNLRTYLNNLYGL